MNTISNAYCVTVNLSETDESSLSFNWQQTEEPTFKEIVKKTMMYCLENKLTNELMKHGAQACVQTTYSHNKVANYIMNNEQLQNQFFESIELAF